jgi:hypothetical protein
VVVLVVVLVLVCGAISFVFSIGLFHVSLVTPLLSSSPLLLLLYNTRC